MRPWNPPSNEMVLSPPMPGCRFSITAASSSADHERPPCRRRAFQAKAAVSAFSTASAPVVTVIRPTLPSEPLEADSEWLRANPMPGDEPDTPSTLPAPVRAPCDQLAEVHSATPCQSLTRRPFLRKEEQVELFLKSCQSIKPKA